MPAAVDRAFERRLSYLVNAGEPAILQNGRKGVEKESLRVDPDGRIVRTADGAGIERIVEEKDAGAAERALDEVNSGIYAFRYRSLTGVLDGLTAENSQGEYYLTDTVSLLRARGEKAAVVCAKDHRELLGINTVDQLAEAEAIHLAMREGR